MITFPNAKINLGLHITQKRKDGYHEIESCMVPIPLCDALEMILDKKPSWNVTGLEVPGDPKDNLILKAEKLLKKSNPALKGEDFNAAAIVKQKRILDSTRDKSMYLGSSYQKCKENPFEINKAH